MKKQGTIVNIVFHSPETFYTVAHAENEDPDNLELFTVVGKMPDLKEGITYEFEGEETVHRSYGEQFAVSSYEEIMPDEEDGIELFLASGIFRGVGKKKAKDIVKALGADALRIIREEPGRLTEVPGIGRSTAMKIADDMQAHMEYAEVAMFFREYGISPAHSMKMYKIYGAATIDHVKENPYRIVRDIPGIGFKTADEIALKMGIPKDSPYRLESGVRYTLYEAVGHGHVFVPLKELTEKAGRFLDVPSYDIEDVVRELAIEGSVRMESLEDRYVVYLFRYAEAENYVVRKLMQLNSAEPKAVMADIGGLIAMTERGSGIELSPLQKDAVISAVGNGVCVITGGPGTGKTTIINTIIRILEDGGLSVAVAAPTGRAAKRITETSGHPASTIHRLLEYYYSGDDNEASFGRDEEQPLEYDAVIIDEMSMVDIMLMEALLKAMTPGMRLIMVGDADQLPSVGAGNVLRDIIESETVHSVGLREIFRQAGTSMITVNAHRINNGERPFLNEKDGDFWMLRKNSDTAVVETIKDLVTTRLPGYYVGTDPLRDIQVLSPVRKGPLGVANLNAELQKVLNPPSQKKSERAMNTRVFREGDKVMQTRNNYSLEWKRNDDFTDGEGVFNGDIGYITSIDKERDSVTVLFDDVRSAVYGSAELQELELAYAITVHKSQGSEFPIVVMPIGGFPPMLAVRNLLYTAVTRGRKNVVLVGDENRLYGMIDNNRTDRRYSGLCVKLAGCRDGGMF